MVECPFLHGQPALSAVAQWLSAKNAGLPAVLLNHFFYRSQILLSIFKLYSCTSVLDQYIDLSFVFWSIFWRNFGASIFLRSRLTTMKLLSGPSSSLWPSSILTPSSSSVPIGNSPILNVYQQIMSSLHRLSSKEGFYRKASPGLFNGSTRLGIAPCRGEMPA